MAGLVLTSFGLSLAVAAVALLVHISLVKEYRPSGKDHAWGSLISYPVLSGTWTFFWTFVGSCSPICDDFIIIVAIISVIPAALAFVSVRYHVLVAPKTGYRWLGRLLLFVAFVSLSILLFISTIFLMV